MKNIKRILPGLLLISAIQLVSLPAFAQTVGLNGKITSAEPKAQTNLFVACVSGTNVVASSTSIKYTTATFYGYKATTNNAAFTANTAVVYIGFKDVGGGVTTANTPAMCDTIAIGSYLIHQAPPGVKYDLNHVYFVGTTGDKVLIVYEQ